MRQCEKQMIKAARNYKPWKGRNTRVETMFGSVHVYFYNTRIAILDEGRYITVTDGGWRRDVTKSRINALLQLTWTDKGMPHIFKKDGIWYLSQLDNSIVEWKGNASLPLSDTKGWWSDDERE